MKRTIGSRSPACGNVMSERKQDDEVPYSMGRPRVAQWSPAKLPSLVARNAEPLASAVRRVATLVADVIAPGKEQS
jgi:hypothetical protein